MNDKKLPTMAEIEKELILRALIRTKGFVLRAAKEISISRSNIYKKIEDYQIDVEAIREDTRDTKKYPKN